MEKANETTEQQAVMDWAAYAVKRWPGLRNLYHVPNEARRSPATAGILKRMGLQSGVPDLILDWPAGAYHGLRLEMKYGRNTPSENQKRWLLQLQEVGYFVAACWGARPAIALLTEYLQLQPGQRMRADTAQWKQRWGFPAVKEDI